MSLMKKGATITLYHKHEVNKTLKVQVEESSAVGKPALVSQTDDVWSAPCDLTGHDASINNGKKSKKKPVRVRFHAEAFQRANEDAAFADQMNAAGVKLLADLLGAVWSFEPPVKADPRLMHVKNLRQLLLDKPIVTQSAGTVALTWPLKDKSLACDTIRSAVQCTTDADAKTAELRFVGRDNLNELLLMVEVDEALMGSDCEVRSDCLQWLLRKKNDRRTTEEEEKPQPFRAWDAVRLGPSKDRLRPMELAEARVLALRRALDESVKVYQDEQTAARRTNGSIMRRPLTVIFRSKNAALMDISNLEPATGPLHVTIDDSPVCGDSLSSSPADSVDSGVSASSESSAPTGAAASRVRQRSMSECYSYGHAPPLKGILKRWPKMSRSVSESHQEEDEEAEVAEDDCREDERQRRLDEIEEVLDNLAASQTSLDTDGNERPMKKRVSFSERVQERCFRPNSSILGQRKKNQKKHRRRQNSGDSTTTVSSDDDSVSGSASAPATPTATFHTLAAQPPLPPAIKPRFFLGAIDPDDDDFQPGDIAQLLMTTTTTSSSVASLDSTIQDMDETIQDDSPSHDSNNNDSSSGGDVDEQDFPTSEQSHLSAKEARKDSGLDLEVVDEMGESDADAVDRPGSGGDRWLSKKRVLAGKTSAHQQRKCSGDSGMSDDEVFAVAAEE